MDQYDEQIERLVKADESAIRCDWNSANGLFQLATNTGRSAKRPDGVMCGCLTLIRERWGCACVAWTDKLTAKIRADNSLPVSTDALLDDWNSLTIRERRAAIKPFAKWQRRLDREIRGK